VNTADFFAERDRLWGLAYRICGTRSDADDVMQEAWLRWTAAINIERPAAWLTTVTSRLSIDRLRKRKYETVSYVGPWLPDLVASSSIPDPADHVELVDSLTVGFLTMLERLEPIERVVFLLADVFGEPFRDIAIAVDRSEVACRQIASRARRRVHDPNRRRPVDTAEQWRLAAAFAEAATLGNLAALHSLLAADSVLLSDGGADVHAARRPVTGPDRISRFIANLARRFALKWDTESALINGEPGLVMSHEGILKFAMVVHATEAPMAGTSDTQAGASISQIFIMRNPKKLSSFSN
jgi:RNA polymerase sigma-70 factor, ECF subfamily